MNRVSDWGRKMGQELQCRLNWTELGERAMSFSPTFSQQRNVQCAAGSTFADSVRGLSPLMRFQIISLLAYGESYLSPEGFHNSSSHQEGNEAVVEAVLPPLFAINRAAAGI